uniref:Protein sleepless n=1 Tax=Anopheles christyi TaxID=43041 RepID=A0A182JXJ0_9DIPT
IILSVASSLSCFSCDHTDSESVCEENLVECDASSASLGMIRVAAFKPSIQIIQSSTFRCFELVVQDNAETLRTRGCSYDSVDVCPGEVRVGVQTGCRWCNEHDGCNSAGSFKASVLLIAGLSVVAAQALRCMQGTEIVLPSDDSSEKNKEKMPEFTECGVLNTGASAASLLVLKPNTASLPSTDYKCYHLRIEESESKKATIVKGCIYKNQNVCDGKFKVDNVREVFCSQCDQDECNSAHRFASNWKILSVTLFTIVCLFMK